MTSALMSSGEKDALRSALSDALGLRAVLSGADTEGYEVDWRGIYHGRALCVVRPEDTQGVATAVKICRAHGVAVVPHGGNTGMVGGAVPDESSTQVVLSLARLNRIRDFDVIDMSMVIEAGVALQTAQEAAAGQDLLFPLTLSSQGSAQIGGILSTNAGGNNTLRYGNARDLVLGLEVVLANGDIWNGLRRLRKDNTGYCLRQLFVGAEGTLGIITAASLKLVPALLSREVALIALPDARSALELLSRFRRYDAEALQAFEYMSGVGIDLVLDLIDGITLPLAARAEHYVLLEVGSSRRDVDLRTMIEAVLGLAFEDGVALDAVLSESEAQRQALWRLREEQAEGQARAGKSIKNDISVPVSKTAEFLDRATAACLAILPALRLAPFGHLGDGNIHFNLVQPEGDATLFVDRSEELIAVVNAIAREYGGSFSAEHGIGQLKRDMLEEWRGGVELDIMARVKAALDPDRMLNPGKLLA
jgi:FAD/FMN-containing dehydrogenase